MRAFAKRAARAGVLQPSRLAALCAAGMALASAGSWLRFLWTGTPRIDTHGAPFLVASAVAGAGLLLAGVSALRLAPRARELGDRRLLLWAGVVQALALTALPLTSSDVYTNLAFGSLARRGFSPYVHAPSELAPSALLTGVPARWVNDPSPYGPLFHPLLAAAAWTGERLGSPLWGSYGAYKLLLALALCTALLLSLRHLREHLPAAEREVFVLLAMSPLLAWEVTAQGHNEGLLVLSLVAFIAAERRGRSALAVTALALGAAVKYALAPLLGLYLLLHARRSLARAAALAVLAALVLWVAFAHELRAVNLRAVLPMVGGEAARHAHSLTDLVCLVLDELGWHAASFAAYRTLSAASGLLCVLLLLRVALRARELEELAHGYLLFLLALYLTAPWFQPWYVAWALPLLLVERDARWRRFLALYSVVTVVQWAAPLESPHHRGRERLGRLGHLEAHPARGRPRASPDPGHCGETVTLP